MIEEFNLRKKTLLEQYKSQVQEIEKQEIVERTLMPCIGGKPSDKKIPCGSKFGGFPDLPNGFTVPEWEGHPLIFLCQYNFEELAPFDLENKLPKKGLLSIFMHLKDTNGNLTIPTHFKGQLKGFYFEDLSVLNPVEDPNLTMDVLKEVPLQFTPYADIPEFGDYRLPETYINFDPDFLVRWELIPQVFEQEDPDLKILGYPTDDALNSYWEWYGFDQEKRLEGDEETEKAFRKAREDFELLFWVGLTELGCLSLEDEYAEFGGISIGIKRADLENKRFGDLYFKYTMS